MIALSFGKPLPNAADEVAELAEETCTECFDKEFNDMFSSSAQDLAASAVANEFNVEKVEKVECDMRQGDKVGTSAVRESTKSKVKVRLHDHSSCLHFPIRMLKLH